MQTEEYAVSAPKEKRSLGQKISMTFGAIIMSPMYFATQNEVNTGKPSFWKTLVQVLKEIWS